MKLRFIFLGKKNTPLLGDIMLSYMKRLGKYVKSEHIFIDEKNDAKLAQKISKHIQDKSYLIVLDEHGALLATSDYAKLVKHKMINHASLIFLIGGAYGVPESIKNRANYLLAVSTMTFPHMIARLILIEQTYRAFCILNNHPYHHE